MQIQGSGSRQNPEFVVGVCVCVRTTSSRTSSETQGTVAN